MPKVLPTTINNMLESKANGALSDKEVQMIKSTQGPKRTPGKLKRLLKMKKKMPLRGKMKKILLPKKKVAPKISKPGDLYNAHQRANYAKAMNAAQKAGGSNGIGVGY